MTEEEIMKRFYGDVEKLDETDKFLWKYVNNNGWMDEDKKETPTYDEIVDSEEEEKADQFEAAYNFRFEDPEGNKVVTHARKVEGSVRNTKDKRKEKRKERNERKETELKGKREELKRLKNMKKQEIAAKLKQISDATGVAPEGLEGVDLDGDFDPEEYDKRMSKAFGGDFYDDGDENAEDTEAFLAQVRQEIDEGGYDAEVGYGEDEAEAAEGEAPWDAENENGDDAEEQDGKEGEAQEHEEDGEEEWGEEKDWGEEGEKKKREHKRKHGKDKVDMGEYLDEYYKLDFEDVVGGMGTRFKYKEVAPVDFGMDAVEILLMDDKKLNKYAGLKKYAAYREDSKQQTTQFSKRRWEYFKKHEGFTDELENVYEELGKKKGPTNKGKKNADKNEKDGKKKRDRDRGSKKRKHSGEEEGGSSSKGDDAKKSKKSSKKDKGHKVDAPGYKGHKGDAPSIDGGAIAADRLSSYTASTKRSKKGN